MKQKIKYLIQRDMMGWMKDKDGNK